MESTQEKVSAFAQLVYKLRNKSDAELKMLYMQFFKNDFEEEWKRLTADADFGNVTDQEIIAAIENTRYKTPE